MPKSRSRFARKLSSVSAAGAFGLVRVLLARKDPLKAERVGVFLGKLAYLIARKQRRRIFSNLRLVYPDMDERERVAFARRCFRHFGMLTADFVRADLRPKNEVVDSIVEVEGFELAEAARKPDIGLIAITGHMGNWERAAAWSSAQGFPLTVVQRDPNVEAMNAVVTRLREASGSRVISRGNAVRSMLEALREGHTVAILADQNADECYIPFLGHPAGSSLGPAVISMRTGAPMLPSYCIRVGPNQYKIVFHPALELHKDAENPAEDLMKQMNASLEKIIAAYPEQWLWFHDRWKNARRKGLVPEL